MKVLILVSGYPSKENLYNCSWAHTRSLQYLKNGIYPIVVNFGIKTHYKIDEINVHPASDIDKILSNNEFSILIMHSPNIRNHFPLCMKISENFNKILIFCHGTESMWINKDYPEPYNFMKDNFFKQKVRNLYDLLKFIYFRFFIKKYKNKLEIIFVSSWMKNIFKKNVLDPDLLNVKNHIISNTIHPAFLELNYNPDAVKYDFITIRRFDDSKYAVDLVVNMAIKNPSRTFHIYGKGNYFLYNEKPANVEIFEKFIKQDEIPTLLNQYKCALMPTRCDAQGVMVCEMATYGVPVITTDIEINQNMLTGFNNVYLLNEKKFNSKINFDFEYKDADKNIRFNLPNTVDLEIGLLKSSL